MIINEHNLIIGTKNTIISDLSISTFYYFSEQINYLSIIIKDTIFSIIPSSTSPPLRHFI